MKFVFPVLKRCGKSIGALESVGPPCVNPNCSLFTVERDTDGRTKCKLVYTACIKANSCA